MCIHVSRIEDAFSLADFLADALGELAEVVVHDVSDTEVSIVHIRNGHLSGRKIGDGATDAALKFIHEKVYLDRDYISNCSGKAIEGRSFRSSTYFIQDHHGALIGMLCVNVDVTALDKLDQVLHALRWGGEAAEAGAEHPTAPLLRAASDKRALSGVEETLLGDPDKTIRRIARTVLADLPVAPDRLSKSERIRAIRTMMGEGVFLMKGAVVIVAEELRVSAPTLYKYLQQIKG